MQDRSSGCLPVDPCCKESKSIPPFSLEGEPLSVHLPVFRTGFLTKNFYQMPEATAGLSSGSWGASAGLPGRFSDNGSYKRATSGTGPANRRIIREARLSDKSREISVKTNPEAGIPRFSNRHCGNEVFLARNENTQTSESGREISLRTNFGKTTSQSSGPVAGYPSSYNNCPFVFSKSPERPFQGSKFLRRKTKLPDSGCAFLGVKRGVDVVEKLTSFPQRENILVPKEQETIFSDASKKGWGAHLGPLEIGGHWCLEERIQHINVLELQVAFLAIKALLPKIDKPHVQFAIDNQTAVTYINKLGGTHSHQL